MEISVIENNNYLNFEYVKNMLSDKKSLTELGKNLIKKIIRKNSIERKYKYN
jgi:hypothetical protein